MNQFHRRRFIAGSSLAAFAPIPVIFNRSLFALEAAKENRALVVIQLGGGNDGMNTVVPFVDELYAKHRKELRIKEDKLIKINDQVGLHPSMRAAADLLEDGRLAIVQGVGYPNPNRSHDVSMSIWQTAKLDPLEHQSHGWLGRAMDESKPSSDNSPQMILLGDETTPVAIRARRSISVAMAHLHDLKLLSERQLGTSSDIDRSKDLVAFAHDSARSAQQTARRIAQSIESSNADETKYPDTALSGRLKSIARLIKSGFSTPIYYAIQAGYDTHATQLPVHARLLNELSGALKAFHNDLQTAGLSDRVLTMGFSEFGRRVQENASLGTDHGAAGPVFIAGSQVRSGMHGSVPSLSDLDDGDLKMSIDFRSVYSALLQDWLGIDSQAVLGGTSPISLVA